MRTRSVRTNAVALTAVYVFTLISSVFLIRTANAIVLPIPPYCNGLQATIFVDNGVIVGGPDNGLAYTGELNGTAGDDVIVGTSGKDIIKAKAGNDTVCGGANDDYLQGDSGNDTMNGESGNDLLSGNSDSDTLYGGNDLDLPIDGGSGTDYCNRGSPELFPLININCESGSVGQVKIVEVSGSATDAAFAGTLGSFSLDDDATATLPNTMTLTKRGGDYNLTQALNPGLLLTNLTCSGGGSDTTASIPLRTATIGVDSSENITCTFTNTPLEADLSVATVLTTTAPVLNDTLTYEITVTNNGPEAADTVQFSDALRASETFQSLVIPAGWLCMLPAVGDTGTILCSTSSMTTGSSVFTLQTKAISCDSGDNVATVSAATPDSNLGNNSSTNPSTVSCAIPATHFWVEPGDPKATDPNVGLVRIDWQAVAGATGYKIHRCIPNDASNCLEIHDHTTGAPYDYADDVVLGAAWLYKVQPYVGPSASPSFMVPLSSIEPRRAETLSVVVDDDSMLQDFISTGTTSMTGTWGSYHVNMSGIETIMSKTVGGDGYSIAGPFGTQTFDWHTNAALDGVYDVSVSYICDSSRGMVYYDVYNGNTKLTTSPIPVDQSLKSKDGTPCGSQNELASEAHWKPLGQFTFTGSGSARVQLVSATGNNVVADAAGFKFIAPNPSSSSSSSSLSSSSSSSVACTLPTGLYGYWPFDENTGTVANDLTANRDGSLENGPLWVTGAPQVTSNVSALSFDGSDDLVRVSTGASAFDFGTSDFTVSLFLKAQTGNRGVLGNYSAAHKGWGLYVYGNGTLNFFGYGSMGSNDTAQSASVLDDQWHHVTGVYSRSGSLLTIATYVDGVLAGTNTTTVGDLSAGSDLLFGKYTDQPSFQGTLDDIRVYNRALTAHEIPSLLTCNNGAGNSSSVTSASSSSSSSSSESSSSSSVSTSSSSSSSSVASSSSSSSTSSDPMADLQIVKTGPETLEQGQPITYTLTVINHGPDTVTSFTVADTFPAGFTFTGGTAGCALGVGGTVDCTGGSLADTQVAIFTLTFSTQFASCANHQNIGTVSTNTATDSFSGNNTSSIFTNLTCPPAPEVDLFSFESQGNGSQGGYIGHRTNEFRAAFGGGKSPFAPGAFGGNLAPGAFGGGTSSVMNADQKKTVCNAQKFLDNQPVVMTDAILEAAAKTLQSITGVSSEAILVALKNPAFCGK